MKRFRNRQNSTSHIFFPVLFFCSISIPIIAQTSKPVLKYIVSMPQPATYYYHVELQSSGWSKDTLDFKMPQWMPGYYQIMNYAKAVENFSAKAGTDNIAVNKINDFTWQLTGIKNKSFKINYNVKTTRQFVATSYLDTTHAYMIPEGLFLYVDGYIKTPVSVIIDYNKKCNKIVTGLDPVPGKSNEFTAPDFDILYDCPLLAGNLEELPSFKIRGIEHRFVGYNMGDFDKVEFMNNLKKVVEAAINIMGDIPYKQYTFIGIGPGRGGIEHLNNTTVSFTGKDLNTDGGLNRVMSFLAHEYFHNYNVKRIRPFELGPFDYDKANKTNLLWVSEGLSVYYEYMIIKRAGIINEQTLYNNFENSINTFENNPGRLYQSLSQSSYETWSDGPFGKQGKDSVKTISYYDKGPAVGLLLDFAIRNSTQNKSSLDDVMRYLYNKYYKQLRRGFTDAEFQEACETIAGTSLSGLFEYVYTTKELDYNTYLGYAGLRAAVETNEQTGKRHFTIRRLDKLNEEQQNILESWLGSKP